MERERHERKILFIRRKNGGTGQVKSSDTFAIFALVISQLFWGSSYLMSDYALEVFPPATLVGLRILIAAIVLGIIGFSTGAIKPLAKKDIKYFLMAAFAEPFIYFLCEAQSLHQGVSPTVVSVVLAFIPLLTPVFAFIAIKEKVTFMNVFGIVISVVGVLMVILEKGGKLNASSLGLVLLFVAVIASITYTLVLRKIPEGYNALTIVFYMFLVSLIFFIPTSLLTEMSIIKTIDIHAEATHQAFLAIFGLAITSSCIAFLFFSFGVRVLGATRANVFNNIQPGVTALLSWALLGVALQAMQIWGIVIVIVGMFVSQTSLSGLINKFKRKKQ